MKNPWAILVWGLILANLAYFAMVAQHEKSHWDVCLTNRLTCSLHFELYPNQQFYVLGIGRQTQQQCCNFAHAPRDKQTWIPMSDEDLRIYWDVCPLSEA